MSRPSRLLHCRLVLAAYLCVGASVALAQPRGEQREAVQLEGKLVALQPGLIKIEAEDGETWLVKVEARGKELAYTATAKPEWLRAGMWVRFRASFDQRGQQQSELSDVTVFTPQQGQQLGLIPEVSLGDGLFEDEEEKPRRKERGKNQVTPYVVAGRVVGLKKAKLTVAAGNVPVTVELPESLRIAVEVSDYSLAQPGDRVSLRGWKYPMVPGRAIANHLTVNSDKVLDNPPPQARRRRGNDKNDDDPDDQPLGDSATPEPRPDKPGSESL